jgi:hypothetical protein
LPYGRTHNEKENRRDKEKDKKKRHRKQKAVWNGSRDGGGQTK